MACPERISSDLNSGRLISRCHSALFLMSFIRSRRTRRWAESTWNSWKCKYIRNSYSQQVINLSSNIISCILILLQNCFWLHHNCPSTFIYLIRYIIQLIAAKCSYSSTSSNHNNWHLRNIRFCYLFKWYQISSCSGAKYQHSVTTFNLNFKTYLLLLLVQMISNIQLFRRQISTLRHYI